MPFQSATGKTSVCGAQSRLNRCRTTDRLCRDGPDAPWGGISARPSAVPCDGATPASPWPENQPCRKRPWRPRKPARQNSGRQPWRLPKRHAKVGLRENIGSRSTLKKTEVSRSAATSAIGTSVIAHNTVINAPIEPAAPSRPRRQFFPKQCSKGRRCWRRQKAKGKKAFRLEQEERESIAQRIARQTSARAIDQRAGGKRQGIE